MNPKPLARLVASSHVLAFALAAPAHAQVLFSEAFDSEATAKVAEALQDPSDAFVTYVDYSSFTIGDATHSIPEAPNRVPGSAPTRGVVIQSNVALGVANPVNLTALDAPGGSPVEFTGNYRLSYDMFLSLDPGADRSSSGTTEVGIWGIGHDGFEILGRTNKDFAIAATWGWVANEGGFGSEDAIFIIDSFPEEAKLNDGANTGLFEAAFPGGAPIVPAPNNSWVRVEVTAINGEVTVKYNDVEFFKLPSERTDGFALIGYEDPFGSLSFSPDYQFGLFDNFVVEVAFEPTILIEQTVPFGTVNEEGATTTSLFGVANGADEPLTVTAANLTGDDAANFAVDTPLPLEIPAGGMAEISVTFTAAGDRGIQTAELEIVSTDAQEPSVALPLEAIFAPVLLAHYQLDETEGTTIADASGNGVDGGLQIRANPVPSLEFGQPALASGTSIRFTDADSSATGGFAVASPLHVPTTSISLWIRPEADGSPVDTLFNRDPFFTGADAIYGCFIDESGVLNFNAGGELVLQSDFDAITDGQSHHVVITHLDEDGFGNNTATRSRMFIDGQLVAENTMPAGFDAYPGNAATRDFYLATRSAAGTGGFTGLIDDVQIYSIELSEFQVSAMFNDPGSTAGSGTAPPFAITDLEYTADPVLGASVLVRWNSRPGRFYTLWWSPDLEEWIEVDDSIASGGLTTEAMETDIPAGTTERYYRVTESQ